MATTYLYLLGYSALVLNAVIGEDCGGDLREDYGTISHPDETHANPYGNNEDCWWNIIGNDTNKIELSATFMSIQDDVVCSFDYLEVFDDRGHLYKMCGSFNPPVLLSSGNVVALHFHSDHDVTGKGFSINYRQIVGMVCGATEPFMIGHIQSYDGDGDGLYDINVNCYWTIIWANFLANVTRQFQITRMDIEESAGCTNDFVLLLDENDKNETYCGKTIPPLYTFTTKYLYVFFYSDSSITGKGFSAAYADQDGDCGGILTEEPGWIYPADKDNDGWYDNNQNCWWAIVAPENSVIELGLFDMSIQYHAECNFDYIQIYDGEISPERYVGYACGVSTEIQIYVSQRNVLYLQFYADATTTDLGFAAGYRHIRVTDETAPTTTTLVSTNGEKLHTSTQAYQSTLAAESTRQQTTVPGSQEAISISPQATNTEAQTPKLSTTLKTQASKLKTTLKTQTSKLSTTLKTQTSKLKTTLKTQTSKLSTTLKTQTSKLKTTLKTQTSKLSTTLKTQTSKLKTTFKTVTPKLKTTVEMATTSKDNLSTVLEFKTFTGAKTVELPASTVNISSTLIWTKDSTTPLMTSTEVGTSPSASQIMTSTDVNGADANTLASRCLCFTAFIDVILILS